MSKLYVGLDISQRFTHICAVDQEGNRVWQGKCLTTPEAIAGTIRAKVPGATSIGMESGALSPWLWHALKAMGLPVAGGRYGLLVVRMHAPFACLVTSSLWLDNYKS
jgi:hypothetical protein